VPADGDVHRFTEPLPRQTAPDPECSECEREIHRHEGPPTPRRFDFAAREVARALVSVGSGTTYRRAGFEARDRSGRLRFSQRGWELKNNDGNTVADWVELFAPSIFEQRSPKEWPRILALDAQPFAVASSNGHPKRRVQPAFHVFGAYGWDAHGSGSVIALRAQPNFTFKHGVLYWAAFLEELRRRFGDGLVEQIVVDADDNIVQAIELVWPRTGPSPVVYVCHRHLKNRLLTILRQNHVAAADRLYQAAEHAFDWQNRWDDFLALARQAGIRQVDAWLANWEPRVSFQIANQRGRKVSVGPLEQALTVVRNNLEDRRGAFKNRERLNRLLMLMQLDLNEQADERRYAKTIRDQLLANGGYSSPRRVIVDQAGASLRLDAAL
jgi:hypothetical protein